MKLEEFRRIVDRLSGEPQDFFILDDALQESLEHADEIISGRGGSVGEASVYIDLTERDIYPLPRAFVRIRGVERLDGLTPWPLSPATSSELGQAEQRNARGGFYALSGLTLRISPVPTTSTAKGLRVWGYPAHRIDIGGSEDQEVPFPDVGGARAFVKWSSVIAVTLDQKLLQRAMMQLQRAEVTFRKHVEIPHVDVPPRVKKEAP